MRPISAAIIGFLSALPFLVVASQTESVSVREENRAVTRECLRAAGAAPVVVDEPWSALCRKDVADPARSVFQQEHARYLVQRLSDDEALVRVRFELDVRPASLSWTRKMEIVEKTRACGLVVASFWARYGIRLELDFRLPGEPVTQAASLSPPSSSIQVSDAFGRSHSRHFFFQGLDAEIALPNGLGKAQAGAHRACIAQCSAWTSFFGGAGACEQMCEAVRQNEYCLALVHETGHLLGLPDEYAESALCPDREFVSAESSPWSAMAVPHLAALQVAGVDAQLVEFFPRHLRRLLKPICGTRMEALAAVSPVPSPSIAPEPSPEPEPSPVPSSAPDAPSDDSE